MTPLLAPRAGTVSPATLSPAQKHAPFLLLTPPPICCAHQTPRGEVAPSPAGPPCNCPREPQGAGCLSGWPSVTRARFKGPFVWRPGWHGRTRPWASFGAVVWAQGTRPRGSARRWGTPDRPGGPECGGVPESQ